MHVFLCGPKHIGKSTLVGKILEKVPFSHAGLISFSRFENDVRNVCLRPDGSEENGSWPLCGVCSSKHITERRPEVFDTYGVSLLETAALSGDIVVIDEIGTMEKDAQIYTECVKKLLSRPYPLVLGVLQDRAETELANHIRSSENIILYRVNGENRDDLVNEAAGRICRELHSKARTGRE